MEKICVIGAGTMGWSIAQVFAQAGYAVRLCDQELQLAQRGFEAMSTLMAKLVDKGKKTPEEAKAALDRVRPSLIEDAADCDFALEAIYENMEAKRQLLQRLEQLMPESSIFATNTSSLSVTEMAAGLQNPARLAGMHFFNPPTAMALVEVICGAHTAPEVERQVSALAEKIGKTPVKVAESPGFVVNRILIPMINEAVCLLAEGVAEAEAIDTAMKLGANHPLGPLALGDLVGLDVCLAIMEVMQRETGEDKYRPHPLLRKTVRAGKLGRKTGQGFFRYSNSKK